MSRRGFWRVIRNGLDFEIPSFARGLVRIQDLLKADVYLKCNVIAHHREVKDHGQR
jgi:hypothetical protein